MAAQPHNLALLHFLGLAIIVGLAQGNICDYTRRTINSTSHIFVFYHDNFVHDSFFHQLVHAFRWESKIDFLQEKSCLGQFQFVYYPRQSNVKQCLLQSNLFTKGEVYSGDMELHKLISFVNSKCGTYRTSSGELSSLGQKVLALETSLYQLQEHSLLEKEPFQPSSEELNFKPPNPLKEEKCDIIDSKDMTEIKFLNEYVAKNRPVIITNASTKWKAKSSWTNEFLLEKLGKNKVHVKVSPDGNFEGCEDIAKWDDLNSPKKAIPEAVLALLTSPSKVLVRPATWDVPFELFLERLNSSQSNTSYYLEYLSIAGYLPQIQKDIEEFPWIQRLDLEMNNIWFGSGNTVGKLHFDPYENLISMVNGDKVFHLFDPSANENFYEGHIREALLEYNSTSDSFYRRVLLESTSMVNSPVDITSPDLLQYPKFANAIPMKCRIQPGDALYLPAFWWHEVESIPENKKNVAVNYWYKPFFTKEFPCQSCRLNFNRDYLPLLDNLHQQYQPFHDEL